MSIEKYIDWNEITERNRNSNYLMYDNNNSKKNILFIGSCRATVLMYFYQRLKLPNSPNLYGITFDAPREDLDTFKKNINKILENTDTVITEYLHNWDVLNSDTTEEKHFRNTFVLNKNTRYEVVPNLELRFCTSVLVKTFKVPFIKEDLLKYFMESRTRLRNNINVLGYSEVNEFIDKNFTEKRLFHLHNHPSNELIFLTFCVLSRKLNITITKNYSDEMSKQKFFDMHNTPIFEKDIELYKFKWCKTVYKDSDFNDTPQIIPLIQ